MHYSASTSLDTRDPHLVFIDEQGSLRLAWIDKTRHWFCERLRSIEEPAVDKCGMFAAAACRDSVVIFYTVDGSLYEVVWRGKGSARGGFIAKDDIQIAILPQSVAAIGCGQSKKVYAVSENHMVSYTRDKARKIIRGEREKDIYIYIYIDG